MIVSTGIRTDIINHYSDWLFERFREGFVYTRNPLFPNRVNSYLLQPDKVDAVLFCSKNYAPALSRLSTITSHYRTFFHYTITAYESDIEPNIPEHKDRIRTLCELEKIVGKERIVWRFEPVFFTNDYPCERVLDTFDRLAEQIAPHVSGCVFGFVEAFSICERVSRRSARSTTNKNVNLPAVLPPLLKNIPSLCRRAAPAIPTKNSGSPAKAATRWTRSEQPTAAPSGTSAIRGTAAAVCALQAAISAGTTAAPIFAGTAMQTTPLRKSKRMCGGMIRTPLCSSAA